MEAEKDELCLSGKVPTAILQSWIPQYIFFQISRISWRTYEYNFYAFKGPREFRRFQISTSFELIFEKSLLLKFHIAYRKRSQHCSTEESQLYPLLLFSSEYISFEISA